MKNITPSINHNCKIIKKLGFMHKYYFFFEWQNILYINRGLNPKYYTRQKIKIHQNTQRKINNNQFSNNTNGDKKAANDELLHQTIRFSHHSTSDKSEEPPKKPKRTSVKKTSSRSRIKSDRPTRFQTQIKKAPLNSRPTRVDT